MITLNTNMETHMHILKQLLSQRYKQIGWIETANNIKIENEKGKRVIQLSINEYLKNK